MQTQAINTNHTIEAHMENEISSHIKLMSVQVHEQQSSTKNDIQDSPLRKTVKRYRPAADTQLDPDIHRYVSRGIGRQPTSVVYNICTRS